MLAYYLSAAALKVFSTNDFMTRAYSSLSGAKRKYLPSDVVLEEKYLDRTESFLDIARRHGFIRDGIKVFELGTGWIHWEALVVRNEAECTSLLYDVVDKRDPSKLRRVLAALCDLQTRRRLGFRNDALIPVLRDLTDARDFESIYARLGFSYMLDPVGRLDGIESDQFDLVISSDVFEHLPYADIPHILRRLREIMAPDGWAYHQVVLVDHLRIYAKSVHPKQYLAYDQAYWDRFLSNGVQYINRVQLPEWREMIRDAGLEIVEELPSNLANLDGLPISSDFAGIATEDLACGVVQFVLRRSHPTPA